MTLEEKAKTLGRDETTKQEILGLLQSQQELMEEVTDLRRRLEWFQKQLFSSKSERRLTSPDAAQLALGESFVGAPANAEAPTISVEGYTRKPARPVWQGTSDGRLKFDPSVPIQDIEVPNPDCELYPPEAYDVVGEKITYRLAQYPGSYVVLRFIRKVLKLRSNGSFSCPGAPDAVLEKSVADVSFIAGLLIDKMRYHLPLYRQHQRLQDCGIWLSRTTLTNLVHGAAALLEPIEAAQRRSILESSVLTVDETPIRAGRIPGVKGKMHGAYFWPMYGDRREVAFPFSTSRSLAAARGVLNGYQGKLLTDGYSVYERYALEMQDIEHAQCWGHARRKYIEAETVEPTLCATALEFIRTLYRHEDTIRERKLEGDAKREYRTLESKRVVDLFFLWLKDTLRNRVLLPTNPFTRAAAYALDRETGLRVFLDDPEVPIDTNHLEREIRPIAVGRKNWLFCWTEIGAKYVGIVQGLIATCRLHRIDPYAYLVDVLQRVATHPAAEVHLLTPRLWKDHFVQSRLRSVIDPRQDSLR
jgi:transposase